MCTISSYNCESRSPAQDLQDRAALITLPRTSQVHMQKVQHTGLRSPQLEQFRSARSLARTGTIPRRIRSHPAMIHWILFALLLAGCGDTLLSGGEDRSLHPRFTAAVLDPGDTLQVHVILVEGHTKRVYPASEIDRPAPTPRWESSDPGVVSVDNGGVLTAHIPGRAVIRIEAAGETASMSVAVRPVPGSAPVAYQHLSIGLGHACALDSGGSAYCWGGNEFGQLGTGTSANSTRTLSPVPVQGEQRFAAIAAATMHTCALDVEGRAYCWGNNDRGQLGDGTDVRRTRPTPIRSDERFVQLTASAGHTCALTTDARAYCWGSNAGGQLGIGSSGSLSDHRTQPVPVAGDLRFVSLSAGAGNTCGIDEDGTAYCWGENTWGELGIGRAENAFSPALVAGSLRFVTITAGATHTCGVSIEGDAYCWGSNDLGQLGTGDQVPTAVPLPVLGSMKFASISVGNQHSCGLRPDGTAYCWGSDWYGQLGTGLDTSGSYGMLSIPTAVAGDLRFVLLTAMNENTCGITSDARAFCWGAGVLLGGTPGHGKPSGSNVPVQVADPF